MSGSFWCLDPSKLPQRLDFEVSDDAYECLQRLSAKAGISVRDLAERLISQSIGSLQLRSRSGSITLPSAPSDTAWSAGVP